MAYAAAEITAVNARRGGGSSSNGTRPEFSGGCGARGERRGGGCWYFLATLLEI
uniref:Uncharacterized protein n=1 Tax=Oryza sativa subsp. japonica TaxID=39947 RepID=Q654H9_ORYSJ|nr:hypothetical protein [Oryza sativa Japonica Group]